MNDLKIFSNIFKYAHEGIVITDEKCNILDVNDEFMRVTGYKKSEIIGHNPNLLRSGRHDKYFYKKMWKAIKKKGYWRGKIWNRNKNGKVYPITMSISSVYNAHGEVTNYVGIFYDISAEVHYYEKLQSMAFYDRLTGLPNYNLLIDRLQMAMLDVKRKNCLVAIAHLDLDNFKKINDRYGHVIGDKLLCTLAERFKNSIREIDTVSRLGGDEFIIIFPGISGINDFNVFLKRIFELIQSPYIIDDLTLKLTASVGVTFYPQQEERTYGQLIRQADQALYEAKLSNQKKYVFYDLEIENKIRNQNLYIKQVSEALVKNEFILFYQPKVNMKTGKVFAAEALIRWQKPDGTMLLPNEFLTSILEDPIMIKIGEWVIDTAIKQLQIWNSFANELNISVNITSIQLERADFLGYLKKLLSLYPESDVTRIEFEILESNVFTNFDFISDLMQECNQLGFNFLLDDFGVGYSSLAYLKRLPIKYMKIDQSFILEILDKPEDIRFLKAIMAIAEAVGVGVIAEGVETQEHRKLLLDLNCENGQGYAIARPMPGNKFKAWYDSWQAQFS